MRSKNWIARSGCSASALVTFAPSVAVSGDPFGGGFDQIGEFIDVTARAGRVHVAWSEGRAGVEDVLVASGRIVAAE